MKENDAFDIYGGQDPRSLPLYSISQAASILGVSASSLRFWIMPGPAGAALIKPAQTQPPALSFINLIEIRIVALLRRQRRLPLQRIRRAISYFSRAYQTDHPLVTKKLATFGGGLYALDEYLEGTSGGQLGLKEVLQGLVRRVEYDEQGLAARFYPDARSVPEADSPRIVVIDPRISFGRPVIQGTGIPTDVVADRFRCGDSIHEIAKDYRVGRKEIEEAIRFETRRAA